MTDPVVTRRIVYHIGGYDSVSPTSAYQRFARELRRFESTWSADAAVSSPATNDDVASWSIAASGPNWRVETEYRLVRWDDVPAPSEGFTAADDAIRKRVNELVEELVQSMPKPK